MTTLMLLLFGLVILGLASDRLGGCTCVLAGIAYMVYAYSH